MPANSKLGMTAAAKAQPLADLKVGGWVRWHNNGWRHGWLKKVGPKWCIVIHIGKPKRILTSEVQAYDFHG